MVPGEFVLRKDPILCNEGKESIKVNVLNRGDRPVQIGSHFHFFEVNPYLQFEREQAKGRHLNIPAGTAVRFEPGDEKEVELVAFSGERKIYGLNNQLNGRAEL
ncbi:urease subunit beta [Halobacillus halophilus]|uniref:Urease subunit beta n=1 Tax=Halobacillus halophilus (strain ATCC 35676 / DSM 2266 / JCM 20832 / KCTC 3685 / LMG 17431 / NBRC 102448 / NCIMB 2269) TaxID=866895 RepID=I0JR95_HALH3|nr:urease subunit beta [Halobacillus halophilus]ASF40651.1 urease subunit beta [Halobacillus halophilus]CCG46665.1 urease beta subunit [Halobacillus halophilus DSM 2266]